MNPSWVIWEKSCLETVIVSCSGDQIEFGLGGQKKDISRSTRRVRGQLMCGLGVLVGLVDVRVLIGVETKVVDSCASRFPHWRMRYVVECRP